MQFARAGKIIFGLGALIGGAAALTDIILYGRLTVLSPVALGAMALFGLAFLLIDLLNARGREQGLQTSTNELRAVTAKLEASLAAMSAMNARLHESESRYKGLVDAQGDAICRRGPDSRLTYGNDAFFKPVRADSRVRASAGPSRPNRTLTAARPISAALPARKAATCARATTSMCAPPMAGAGSPGRITRSAIPHGRLIEIQSVGRDITERKALEEALTEARDKRRRRQPRQIRLPRHHES